MDYRERANAIGYQWLEDRDGDICLRPILWHDEGKPQLQYRPDPVEYRPLAEAIKKLEALELYDRCEQCGNMVAPGDRLCGICAAANREVEDSVNDRRDERNGNAADTSDR